MGEVATRGEVQAHDAVVGVEQAWQQVEGVWEGGEGEQGKYKKDLSAKAPQGLSARAGGPIRPRSRRASLLP